MNFDFEISRGDCMYFMQFKIMFSPLLFSLICFISIFETLEKGFMDIGILAK